MIKAILLILALMMAVLGLAEFLHGIVLFLKKPKQKANAFLLLFLTSGSAQEQLGYAVEKQIWSRESFTDFILACTDELDAQELEACRGYAKLYNVVLCKSGNVEAVARRISGIVSETRDE